MKNIQIFLAYLVLATVGCSSVPDLPTVTPDHPASPEAVEGNSDLGIVHFGSRSKRALSRTSGKESK